MDRREFLKSLCVAFAAAAAPSLLGSPLAPAAVAAPVEGAALTAAPVVARAGLIRSISLLCAMDYIDVTSILDTTQIEIPALQYNSVEIEMFWDPSAPIPALGDLLDRRWFLENGAPGTRWEMIPESLRLAVTGVRISGAEREPVAVFVTARELAMA